MNFDYNVAKQGHYLIYRIARYVTTMLIS